MHRDAGQSKRDDILAAQKEIDIELESETHLKAIQALKTRRNSLSLISQLPAEILEKIFTFVKIGTSPVSHDLSGLRWIKVSHVSSHWRDIALNCATLWSSPPADKTQWQDEMIRRSKMADLAIKVDLQCVAGARLKEVLDSELHRSRIRHLTIINASLPAQPTLDSLPTSMPSLQTLSILSTPFRRIYNHLGEGGMPHIAEGIFANSKNLLSLELGGVGIKWHLLPLSNITEAKIDCISRNKSPSFTEFFDALRGMPRVESLHLTFAIAETMAPGELNRVATVQLPHLRKLSLTLAPNGIAAFYRHVTFSQMVPAKLTLAMHGLGPPQEQELATTLFDVAAFYSHPAPGQEFRTLFLDAKNYPLHIYLVRKIVNGNASFSNPQTEDLTISVTHGLAEESLSRFFNNGFNLDNINHVQIKGISIASRVLEQTIGTLKSVTSITMVGWGADVLVGALLPRRPRPGASPIHFFPKLASLHLLGTEFHTAKTPLPDYCDFLLLKKLKECLRLRYKYAKIKKLALEKCYNLKAIHVAELRTLGAQVKWDGVEMEKEAEEFSEGLTDYD